MAKLQAIFMMGGPAAGKSTIVERDYAHLLVLDCDRFKCDDPEYDPKHITYDVHRRSRRRLAQEVARVMGEAVESFVLDGTGCDAERMAQYINRAIEAGYETTLVYVKTSLRTALARNAARERVVPEFVVREKHATVGVAFEMVSHYPDHVRVINTD